MWSKYRENSQKTNKITKIVKNVKWNLECGASWYYQTAQIIWGEGNECLSLLLGWIRTTDILKMTVLCALEMSGLDIYHKQV